MTKLAFGQPLGLGQIEQISFGSERSDTDGGRGWGASFTPKGAGRPMSKAAREYHLIDDLVGISHGGFVSLAGARQFARQEGLSAWDIFHGNDRIEYHDPYDQERSDLKAKQDLWMCLLLRAPTHYPPS